MSWSWLWLFSSSDCKFVISYNSGSYGGMLKWSHCSAGGGGSGFGVGEIEKSLEIETCEFAGDCCDGMDTSGSCGWMKIVCCPLVAVDSPPIARIDPFDFTLAGRFTLAG